MRSLIHARHRANELRAIIGSTSQGLLDRLRAYLENEFKIELCPVPSSVIDDGRAEVSPSEHCLNYDQRLDQKPFELLWVLAHELGHLALHKRLTKPYAKPNPLLGSIYLNDGAPALARYSRRSREEAEANAFANEFICPSREVFDEWRGDPNATSYSIANLREISEKIVRVQLAEALYYSVIEDDQAKERKPRKEFSCNERQTEAATFTGAPALVTAGPGTGKTATLVRRIEFLLREGGAPPEELLVLTFSNDAAEELRERVAAKFGEEMAAEIEIATFHGFGFSFLHSHALMLDPDVSILDEAGQGEIVTRILGDVDCPHLINLREPEETVEQIVRHINYLKDRVIDDQIITPELLAAEISKWSPTEDEHEEYEKTREFLELFRAYEAAKLARPAIDFADMIALPLGILAASPELTAKVREKYRWIMVDEYQDVGRSVALLLKQLCGDENPPWVVGDLRQAIYLFRGAAPENVLRFIEDFRGAKIFDLNINYRSCDRIISSANQLADLMASEEETEASSGGWTGGTGIGALAEPVIAIARANSDLAEYDGIAAQVRAWLDLVVSHRDIAVLARRNIDVQNIVLALGKRGIRATTSGIITAEGAAGDLAAVPTFLDQPIASLPRIFYNLARGRFDNTLINQAIRQLVEEIQNGRSISDAGTDGEIGPLIAEVKRLQERLQVELYSGDAFALMCSFLFNGSNYLRHLLTEQDCAKRELGLGEIITSLSRAAAYRLTHLDLSPVASRIGFGQYFRSILNSSAPCLEAPRSQADAVRVMTCHASKGLEFPCVIVAGQTLSQLREEWWLPASLKPSAENDIAQANALLFVGVTRAQRALVVSCAETKSGKERSSPRTVTPLLERWQSAYQMPSFAWSAEPAGEQPITIDALWGGSPRGRLAARTLDEKTCAIRTYLEEFVGVRFPTSLRSLYSIFFVALRLAMERVVRQAHESRRQVTENEAVTLFAQAFPEAEFGDHPHYSLYRRRGAAYNARFARVYVPQPKAIEFYDIGIDAQGSQETRLALRFDLVAYFRGDDGLTHAISFRPESLAKSAAKGRANELVWSGLSSSKRIAFLMLRGKDPSLQPWVFSAADGVLYKFLWNKRTANMQGELDRAVSRLQAFGCGEFETKLNERTCERCPVRVPCPHWIRAIP